MENALLEGLKVEVIEVEYGRLRLLEKNARYMDTQTYRRLVENIRRDGCLTSLPFVAAVGYYDDSCEPTRDEDGAILWEVISGNHRVRAALDAGLVRGPVLACLSPLSRERRVALQLAHNAIVGRDDLQILRELYESIQSVDLKIYSGLDDRTVGLYGDTELPKLPEVNFGLDTITFAFFPEERVEVSKGLEILQGVAGKEVCAALGRHYELFLEVVDAAAQTLGVQNRAVAIVALIGLGLRHMGELGAELIETVERQREWTPLLALWSTTSVPPGAALTIRRAIARALERGDVSRKNVWQLMEYWAADYLAEVGHGTD